MTHHGQPHPDDPSITCELDGENHPTCTGRNGGFDLFDGRTDWPNPDYVAPKIIRAATAGALRIRLDQMSARVAPAPRVVDRPEPQGFAAGVRGSERAAAKWTEAQVALVDAAILTVARRHAGGGEFTSDDLWNELNGSVPVTKGLTARLLRASRRRIIDSTSKTTISQRGGHHDHGQRLTLWYSLINK